jgi:hypothetical protein
MKKILFSFTAFVLLILIITQANAQAPQAFSYQAVVRNSSNDLVVNTAIGMQVSILQGSSTGTLVYEETHSPTTNDNGLLSIEVGTGTVGTGDFTTIDWAAGPYFIKTEIDLTGGSTYSIEGVSQLLSVPYALYAGSVPADADGDSTNELQTLSFSNDTLYISDGNSVELPSGGADLDWVISGNDIYNENQLGNVGIGTMSPQYRLTVGDTGLFRVAIGHDGNFNEPEAGRFVFTEDISFAGTCGFEFHHDGAANTLSIESGCTTLSDTSIVFTRTGEVRIPERVKIGENSNPSVDVHIKQSTSGSSPGSAGIRFEEASTTNQWQLWNGGIEFNFAYNGTRVAFIGSTGTYNQVSDRRFKSNITDMDNVLPRVLQLRPVDFTYNFDNGGSMTPGFIAQEVYELFPSLVSVTPETGYLAIPYANFSVIAVKAIQEQQVQMDEMKKEIEFLKAEIEALKAR